MFLIYVIYKFMMNMLWGRHSVNLHFTDLVGNQDPEPLGTQTVNGLQVVQNTQDLLFDVCSFALCSVNSIRNVIACVCL